MPKATRRLEELHVREISLVDKPAIDETFLVAKRAEAEEAVEESPDTSIVKAEDYWLTQYIETKAELEALKHERI